MIKSIDRMNLTFYTLFLLLTLYHVFVRVDILDGASTLGIALIFDPFDHRVSWEKRPKWQKAWLILHLIVLAILFIIGIFTPNE